jgi:hypothetical protein
LLLVVAGLYGLAFLFARRWRMLADRDLVIDGGADLAFAPAGAGDPAAVGEPPAIAEPPAIGEPAA